MGLSKTDTFFRIILPQAFKTVLPPVANEIVTLVKDTALVYVIGLDELLRVGKIACNRDSSLLPLLIIGLVYLILIGIFTKLLDKLEKNINITVKRCLYVKNKGIEKNIWKHFSS